MTVSCSNEESSVYRKMRTPSKLKSVVFLKILGQSSFIVSTEHLI